MRTKKFWPRSEILTRSSIKVYWCHPYIGRQLVIEFSIYRLGSVVCGERIAKCVSKWMGAEAIAVQWVDGWEELILMSISFGASKCKRGSLPV